MELKSRKLTLIGTMKKYKACIPPSFLGKSMWRNSSVRIWPRKQFHSVVRCSKKKTRGSSSCPLCIPKKERWGYWKRINIRVLQPGKRWWGQSWSNVQLEHNGKKQSVGKWGSFIEWLTAALNAFVIFTEIMPNFGAHKDKRQKFLKELVLALIIPHASQRLEVQQTPQDVKQEIGSCGILPAPSPGPSTTHRQSAQHKRCYISARSKDKKTINICN